MKLKFALGLKLTGRKTEAEDQITTKRNKTSRKAKHLKRDFYGLVIINETTAILILYK